MPARSKKNGRAFFASAMLLLLGGTLHAGEFDRPWGASVQNFGTNNAPVEALASDSVPAGPEAKKELSVKREEIFEFTSPPRVTRAGDRIDIYFETKAFCDATVAIENSSGKIIRHLASGVLGSNAPDPFEKSSKKQHVVWNGKDDFGVYTDDKDALTVRVSLGLKASFEKNLHYHPMQALGRNPIIHASPEGVFIYQHNANSVWDYLQQFDHEGHYVKTLHPFAANALDKIKGLNMIYAWPEDKKVPAKSLTMYGSLLPFSTSLFDNAPAVGDFTVRNGWLALMGYKNFARLNVDGTTRGMSLVGGSTGLTDIKRSGKSYARRSAASPDGKWIYLTRAYCPGDDGATMSSLMDHAVYRMPFDGSAGPQVFLGEPQKKGGDNEHFNTPSGIAVDPQGRIYVTDWDNDRVQVFSPEGKLLKTIPSIGPADIAINQKTGEIYVFSWVLRMKGYGYAAADEIRDWCRGEGRDGDYNLRGSPIRVKKIKPFDAGAGIVYEENILCDGKPMEKYNSSAPLSRVEVDGWAPQTTIWWVRPGLYQQGPSRIWMLKEENNKLTLSCDFEKECEKAGLQSYRYNGNAYPLQRQFLYFDPKHQVLYMAEDSEAEMKYFSKIVAIDVVSGHEKLVTLPFSAADAAIDAKGRIYLLNDDIVGRFDLETWNEMPFDYGKEFGRSGKIVSVVQTIGGHYSSYKHQSLGVSPQGDVIVAGMKNLQAADRRKEASVGYGFIPWRPVVFPGRPNSGACINVFNIYGEMVHEDVLAGIGAVTGGLDMDWQNNIYAAVPAARSLDKRLMKYCTGTLAKFKPEGGRFLVDKGGLAPLDKTPETPFPVVGNEGEHLWIEGSQWLFGGTANGLLWLNCACREARFKTDYFGRSFVPEAWRYSVAVVDNAGNAILRIGQYGNVDSAGPKSLVPLGGDEIGLFDAQFVTMDTDKRVFIGDAANGRIVSGLLGYHTEQRLALKDVRDEAKK
jgi:hypothetical protein